LKVYLAGRVSAESDGVVIDERRLQGRKGRLLFARLVIGQGRPIPRDELADVLWEGSPPPTWEKALGVLASRLRGVLVFDGAGGGSTLTAASGCYRLDLPHGSWIDVVAAKEAANEAEAALGRNDVDAAKRAATVAESLLLGQFLPGNDGTWVEEMRRELAGVRTRALSALADACLRSGDAQESVRWAEQAVEAEPFRESGYRRLMEAHIAAGDRADALRVYERCRRLLAEELGAFPSPETEALYRDLLEVPSSQAIEPVAADASHRVRGRRTRRRGRISVLIGVVVAACVTVVAVALASRGQSASTVVPNSLIRIDPHTLRVTQVVSVDTQPDLVIAAGGYVWVTSHILRDIDSGRLGNTGHRTLTRVDPSNGRAEVVGGGLAPCGLTADPSGDVWVANCYPRGTGSRDNVIRVGARTLDFERTFPVPGGDGFFRGLAYGGGSLWVGNIEGGDVANPSTITEINPQTGAEGTIRPRLPTGAMTWADGYGDLWMVNFDEGTLTRLHVSTDTLKTMASQMINPDFPLVDGDTVWFGDWARSEVGSVSAVGPPRARRIVLPAHRRSAGVWRLAAGAGSIWATTPRDGTLWRIDPNTDEVTRIAIPYRPAGVAADANDVWVTVRG
jgi:DNA-binding SARP family transcriptional activator/streptogramin lyase